MDLGIIINISEQYVQITETAIDNSHIQVTFRFHRTRTDIQATSTLCSPIPSNYRLRGSRIQCPDGLGIVIS